MDTTVSKQNQKLIRTKWGFYQFHPLPSDTELRMYYANKYYQEGRSSYEVNYIDEEIRWLKLKSNLIYRKVKEIIAGSFDKFIDIGCGEGWLMNEFHRHGHSVLGMDYSIYALEKFHPHLLKYFQQGNLYQIIGLLQAQGQTYDVVSLCNVIEHVKDPFRLLVEIKSLLNFDTLLIITAPNDFSMLHELLLEKGFIEKKWWIAYPDHLSYFNSDSMSELLGDVGFKIKSIVADNPIDLNLLNENSNYIKDKSKGKKTHLFRVRMDNFFGDIDPEKLLNIYTEMGSMGVGRNLTYYCTLQL